MHVVRQSMAVTKRTGNFQLMSREEAEKEEERLKGTAAKSPTVFSRLGKKSD